MKISGVSDGAKPPLHSQNNNRVYSSILWWKGVKSGRAFGEKTPAHSLSLRGGGAH
jgi:hypothetical protein